MAVGRGTSPPAAPRNTRIVRPILRNLQQRRAASQHLIRHVPGRSHGPSSAAPRALPDGPFEFEIGPEGHAGAHVGTRTRGLFLTKEVLCRLSYVGACRAEIADPPKPGGIVPARGTPN